MPTSQLTTAPPSAGVGTYAKGLTALVGVAVALALAYKDDVLSVTEASTVAIALLGAVGTYLVRNREDGVWRYAKAIVAFAAAAAGVLPTYLAGWSGLDPSEWVLTIAQIVFAALVLVVPNARSVVDELLAQGLELGVLDVPEPEDADTTGEPVPARESLETGMLPAVTATSTPADARPDPARPTRALLRRGGGTR